MRKSRERIKALAWALAVTAVLALTIVAGSRNLAHSMDLPALSKGPVRPTPECAVGWRNPSGENDMSESIDRLREHPEGRFEPEVHEIDLSAVAQQIEAEQLGEIRKHRQRTLYKHGAITVALFHFEAGSGLPPHVAGGVVTVHVLTGRLRMMAQGQAHDLPAGKMLVMAPGVRHDVQAMEASRMLLTVCLDESAPG